MTDDGKLGAFITDIRKGGPADRQAQLQIGNVYIAFEKKLSLIHNEGPVNHFPLRVSYGDM